MGCRAVDKKHKIPSKVLLLGNSDENPVEPKGLAFFSNFLSVLPYHRHAHRHTLLAVFTQQSQETKNDREINLISD